jgi:hypothetical protein
VQQHHFPFDYEEMASFCELFADGEDCDEGSSSSSSSSSSASVAEVTELSSVEYQYPTLTAGALLRRREDDTAAPRCFSGASISSDSSISCPDSPSHGALVESSEADADEFCQEISGSFYMPIQLPRVVADALAADAATFHGDGDDLPLLMVEPAAKRHKGAAVGEVQVKVEVEDASWVSSAHSSFGPAGDGNVSGSVSTSFPLDLCADSTTDPYAVDLVEKKGRRCQATGCTKCAQGSTSFCIRHGGGRRCTYPDCGKGARDKRYCALHGGGKRCSVPMCGKSAVGGSSVCTGHGGGKRCNVPNCTRSAQSSTLRCVRHGGGRLCVVDSCAKVAR